jgi:hypothetical protein
MHEQDFRELLPFPDTLDIACVTINQDGDIFATTNTQYVTDGVFRSTIKVKRGRYSLQMEILVLVTLLLTPV